MTKTLRIGVVGAGLIGARHAAEISEHPGCTLAGIADPSDAAVRLAADLHTVRVVDIDGLIRQEKPDALIIATPNQMHRDHALTTMEAGIPVLIEKPIADTAEAGEAIVEAAERTGTPVLIGHHRRHNPLIRDAHAFIQDGGLGRIVSVQASFWLMKPDSYFDVAWRRVPGAGPVLINLIHDIDLLRHLCGEIESVFAMESSAARGFPVEDSMSAVFRFAGGALGTVSISDSIAAPWSWEMTAGENPAYPKTDETCYRIGGTRASLALPERRVWYHPAEQSWWAPLESDLRPPVGDGDPIRLQLDHFLEVISGQAQPRVSAVEGLRSLKVIEALKQSARDRQEIAIA